MDRHESVFLLSATLGLRNLIAGKANSRESQPSKLASFLGHGTTVQCQSHCVSLSCPEVKLKICLKRIMNDLTTLNKQ